MASTPTSYDPRNGQSGTLTPTLYSRQNYGDGTTSSMTVRPMISCRLLCGNSLNQSKEMDFEGMLWDENCRTKVITLNGTVHTMDANGGGMSDVEAGMMDNENKEDGKYSVHSRATAMHDGLPEGAMAPRTPGSSGSHSQLRPELTSSAGHEHANNETSATAAAAAPVPSPATPSTKRGANIFHLHTSSSSLSTSKQHHPTAKPKVEFKAHLTSGGEMEEESDPFKANRTAEGGNVPSEGDGFIKEAAQLAERERWGEEVQSRTWQWGSRSKGGDDADDTTWVDIVVPSIGGGSSGSGEGRKAQDPDEAS
ncbi:hypothetical protein GYMLUDRAFT_250213 [Collybiopsis luxurians FD-317 M1]|uniref:Uncharacterized protein n=1 Tax=Collybiopsis luxurians FD-317 M1 TaxID=944289 RepID=A0A0D0C6X8_9AGAR|nr:hypothetical protein GYMLUDRAFT_250213 [Collybiopsis luxurians FD-317 M1]